MTDPAPHLPHVSSDDPGPSDAHGPSTGADLAGRTLLGSLAWAWAGVALAFLGATWIATIGPTYLVPIDGYDPRHPVAGRYLAFRYRWNVPIQPPDAPVSEQLGLDHDAPPSCMCFPDPARDEVDPSVTVVPCNEIEGCAASVTVDVATQGARLYVPEADTPMLDELIRTRAAAVRVRVSPTGSLVPVELYLVEAEAMLDPDSALPTGTALDLPTQRLRPWRELR